MDTERLKAILRGERSGDLDEAESVALEALLRDDPAARDLLAQAEDELATVAARFEPPELPASAWARVDAAVKAEAKQPIQQVGRRFRSMPVWIAAAASVLLVIGINFVPKGSDVEPRPGNTSFLGPIRPIPTPEPAGIGAIVQELRPLEVEIVGGDEGLGFDAERFDVHNFPITFSGGEDTLVNIVVREKL